MTKPSPEFRETVPAGEEAVAVVGLVVTLPSAAAVATERRARRVRALSEVRVDQDMERSRCYHSSEVRAAVAAVLLLQVEAAQAEGAAAQS